MENSYECAVSSRGDLYDLEKKTSSPAERGERESQGRSATQEDATCTDDDLPVGDRVKLIVLYHPHCDRARTLQFNGIRMDRGLLSWGKHAICISFDATSSLSRYLSFQLKVLGLNNREILFLRTNSSYFVDWFSSKKNRTRTLSNRSRKKGDKSQVY